MCIVCADMSGQLRRSNFVSEEIGLDLAVSSGQRAAGVGPLAFLDLDERGGTAPNGKISLTPTDAGTQITRSGASWSTLGQPATITYAFRSNAPTTMPSDTTGFSRFNVQQIQATELMLQAWSDVARITFNRVGTGTEGDAAYSDSAVMLFGNYSAGQSGAAAFAYFPGSTNHAANSGDVWINSSLSYNSAPGYLSYGYQVLLHEIGHGIGLGHPGDYNAGSGGPITYANSAEYYEDSRQYTVMSYFSETNTGGAFGGRYAASPLLDDIAAAQRLYGANMATRTGDTVYGFNSTADRMWYNAGTQLGPQAVIFAVWDAGGTDTLDFQYYTNGGLIDLRQGHFSSVGGLTGNVAIAMGAVIENAIGGGGAETIIGNATANVLRGNGGNDQIEGGAGSDTAVFSGNRAQYTVTVGTEVVDGVTYGLITVAGPDGTDTLRNVEFLQFADETIAAPALTAGIRLEGDAAANILNGTSFADWLFGADGIDTLNGGDGNDRLAGGRGNDTLNGGAGADEADFSGANGAVSVNLGAGTAIGVGADGTDTLNSIENIRGSAYNDTLIGDSGANVIRGGGGVDTINGEGGADTLIAGEGAVVGAEDVIKGTDTSNSSIGTAVNIDGNFDLVDDPGVLNATTTPHAVIRGAANGFGLEYYEFTVTAGAACTFDIASASFDTVIQIFDAAGNRLAVNDDDASSTNSLLNHTFAAGGTYYIAIGRYASGSGDSVVAGNPAFGSTYVLNVSIPNHPVVEAQELGSTLNGGGGDDMLVSGVSNDTLHGGGGNDTAVYAGNRSQYVITDNGGSFTITGPDGTDTLTGVEFAQFADITVALGAASIDGTSNDDMLWGTAGPDTINGLGGNDILRGGLGNDTLNGGAGNDTLFGQGGDDNMVGGAGNDTYVLIEAGDVIVENAGEGTDTVQAWRKYALGANLENLTLMASVVAGEGNSLDNVIVGNQAWNWLYGYGGSDTIDGGLGNDNIYGGDGNDVLIGDEGDDWIDSGTGADAMTGGAGNDTYVVDNVGDTITELAGGGADTVRSWINWTLQDQLENLTLLGSAVSGTGNSANNVLTGNGATNYLAGLDGNDTLDGGGGDDFLYGGLGDDTYVVTEAGDQTIENFGQGTDTVQAWIGWTLGANVENLQLMGLVVGGGGNTLNNVITGNAANNFLYGYGGDDTLIGAGGNDTLSGGSGVDTFVFTGAFGQDTIIDFYAAPGASDVIRFTTDVFADFAAVMAAATDGPGGVVITASGGRTVTLTGVTKAQLSADDFQFSAPSSVALKDSGPQILPTETDGKSDLFVDDAIICPDLGDRTGFDDAWTVPGVDETDPLILPADFSPKVASTEPLVCDPGAADNDLPFAFVADTETQLASRDPHRLLLQPTANDWVW